MSLNPLDKSNDSLTPILIERHEILLTGLTRLDDLCDECNPHLERATECLRALERLRQDRAADQFGHDAAATEDLANAECDRPVARTPRLGKFLISTELGRGAHGVVYRAHDTLLKREVALKIPRAETLASPERRHRFLQESRAVAGLSHPNIVSVYECGEIDSACYIASERCAGPTLAEWLRSQAESVDLTVAAWIVAALADGVAHVHSRGILHRDIKPSNVLLHFVQTSSDEFASPCVARRLPGAPSNRMGSRFVPKLTDFGLAKVLEDSDAITRTGVILGTPQYMAPEQAEGRTRDVGTAADIYALGAILYELVTGRAPFPATTALNAVRKAAEGSPTPPRRIRGEVSRDLQAICLKCLELQPAARYRTAAALADDLRHYLAGEPVSAREPGVLGRLVKWGGRAPLTAGLTATVVLLFVIGFVAVTWQWRRAEQFRQFTERNLEQAYQGIRELHYILYDGDRYDKPEYDELRRDLMAASVKSYRTILDHGGTSPNLRADYADACYQLGVQARKRNDLPEAASRLEASLPIRRALAETDWDNLEYRQNLSKTLMHLGDVYRKQDRLVEALPLLQESLDIRESLVAIEGDRDAMLVGTLAESYSGAAGLLRSFGRLEESLKNYSKALTIRERAAAADPNGTLHLVRTTADLNCMARVLQELRRPEEALLLCEQARERQSTLRREKGDVRELPAQMLETLSLASSVAETLGQADCAHQFRHDFDELFVDLARRYPGDRNIMHELAVSRRRFARTDAARNDLPSALASFSQCHALFCQIADSDSSSPHSRLELAKTCKEFARVKEDAGDTAGARVLLEQARSILEQLLARDASSLRIRKAVVYTCYRLGNLQDKMGDPVAASKTFEQAVTCCRTLVARDPLADSHRRVLFDCEARLSRIRQCSQSAASDAP